MVQTYCDQAIVQRSRAVAYLLIWVLLMDLKLKLCKVLGVAKNVSDGLFAPAILPPCVSRFRFSQQTTVLARLYDKVISKNKNNTSTCTVLNGRTQRAIMYVCSSILIHT
jgi:hypothetical protein